MRFPILFLFLFTCCLEFQAFGQGVSTLPVRKNEIGLTTGFHHAARQDLLFSPLLYKGASPTNASLHWRRQNTRSTHHLRLGFDLYEARGNDAFHFYAWEDGKKTETMPSTFAVLDIRYAWLRQIKNTGPWTLQVGGALQNQVSAIFMQYGFHSFFGYTGVLGLHPVAQGNYRLSNRKNLSAELSFLAAGWLARSPYAVNDDEFIERQSSHHSVRTLFRLMQDGELASVDQVQQLSWQAGYAYQFGEHWTVNLAYEGQYFRCTEPRILVFLHTRLNAGVSFHF